MNTISLCRHQRFRVIKGGAQTVLLQIGGLATGTTVEISLDQAIEIRNFLDRRLSPSISAFSGVEIQ